MYGGSAVVPSIERMCHYRVEVGGIDKLQAVTRFPNLETSGYRGRIH